MKDICLIKAQLDYIIVGQGLAGSCLALQLIRQGKKICVFDEPQNNRASAVAAGLFNPVTGKFLKQAWIADKIYPYLFEFYSTAEKLLGRIFFYPQPIYRPFINIEEQNEWMARSEEPHLKKFISTIFTQSAFGDQSNDPFGGILTKQSGYLDTNQFMQGVADLLRSMNSIQEESFDCLELQIFDKKIVYKNIEASGVIFCDGLGIKTNPFFNWVPIRSLKGETLTVSLTEKPEVIFNRGVYLVPTGSSNEFLVGATYNPNDLSAGITHQSRIELEEKLKDLIKIPFTICHQNWGMRSTTVDRKPVLGSHPEYKNLIIFNSLGTKGVSLAPYFSSVLAEWLEGKTEIPFEVNIERFKSLYSKFSFAKL
jgi:glycine oxidase